MMAAATMPMHLLISNLNHRFLVAAEPTIEEPTFDSGGPVIFYKEIHGLICKIFHKKNNNRYTGESD